MELCYFTAFAKKAGRIGRRSPNLLPAAVASVAIAAENVCALEHWIREVDQTTAHAKNKIAGRMIPFLVLGFWDKSTGICASAMPYRRDFQATTRI